MNIPFKKCIIILLVGCKCYKIFILIFLGRVSEVKIAYFFRDMCLWIGFSHEVVTSSWKMIVLFNRSNNIVARNLVPNPTQPYTIFFLKFSQRVGSQIGVILAGNGCILLASKWNISVNNGNFSILFFVLYSEWLDLSRNASQS